MITTIHMPEEGNLAAWIRRAGDDVRGGDLLAIVECADGRYDWIECPCDGTLAECLADGGARLDKGAALGELAVRRPALALAV